ncbi:MAG: hypothetical protein ABI566_13435 [Pseudolysinimonas sp.]
MKIAALSVPAILLIALTACSPGTGDGEIVGGSPTDCITGTWDADVADLAAQMQAYLIEKGHPIISSTASGTQQLALTEDGYAGWAAENLQFVTVFSPSEGITVTTTQTHNGSMRADWGWDSDTVFGFSDITDEGYDVETVSVVNGTSTTPSDMSVAEGGMSAVPITAQCEGDLLVTKAEGSPFTTTWHRID